MEPFFRLYDLNQDGIIRWDEYSFVNKYHGRSIKGASDTFTYIDGNNDWEITRNEFSKTQLSNLDPKLPASVRRKTPIPRHGHSTTAAPTDPGAAGVAAGTGAAYASRPAADQYDPYYHRVEPSARRRDTIDIYATPAASRRPTAAGDYNVAVDPTMSASERI